MRYLTLGDIHRIFKQEDSGTIIRRNNVRRIALQNGIKHTISQNIILIDSKDFFEKVNPYLIKNEKIFSFKHGNRWVLNYDEVLKELKIYVKTYKGHPNAKKKRKK